MSNLSDIGFPVRNEQDVNDVIMSILQGLEQIPCPPHGFYFKFEDDSGAQIYLQTNPAQEIVGFNPAFRGESSRLVRIEQVIDRDTSDLDGGFLCTLLNDENRSPVGQLVFDSADFRLHKAIKPAFEGLVGLTAFASNDFEVRAEGQWVSENERSPAEGSLIATGLKNEDDAATDPVSPQAHATLSGRIIRAEARKNGFTGEKFYSLVVETSDGPIDVVADPELLKTEPEPGNIVRGSFWISGKVASSIASGYPQ